MDLYVCTVIRDEADYIEEWLAHYRRHGVTRFFLYDNDSTDGWRTDATDVVVTPWPGNRPDRQLRAFEACLSGPLAGLQTWTLMVDVDEYVYHPDGRRIIDVLPEDGAMAQGQLIARVDVPWRMFGWKPHTKRPTTGGTVANYLWRAVDDCPLHTRAIGGKCIVRPALTYGWVTPHHVHSRGVVWVNSGLLANHYWTRSLEEARAKAAKPAVMLPPGWEETPAAYEHAYNRFFEYDLNTVYDDRLARQSACP